MHVTIAIPNRGNGLPLSIRFRQITTIPVAIHRAVGAPQGPVQFTVANTSDTHGVASIVSPQQLDAAGMIFVQGDAQTEPCSSGRLVIKAMLDGNIVGESDGFSVCSHPVCVENGLQHETIDLDHEDSDNSMVGLKVWMHFPADSGVDDDLSAVCEKEIVAVANDSTGALTNAPPSYNSGWQSVPEVEPDRHRLRADLMNMINQRQLHGSEGGWSNDQLDIFYCHRCGMSDGTPAVIPNSGYRVTRVISTAPDNRLQLALRKYPQACTIMGFETAAGPSQPLCIETTVPQQQVEIG